MRYRMLAGPCLVNANRLAFVKNQQSQLAQLNKSVCECVKQYPESALTGACGFSYAHAVDLLVC